MSTSGPTTVIEAARLSALLKQLEVMAAGDDHTKLPLSPMRDDLDAIAYGINVLADELRWANARINEAERRTAAELRRAMDKAERANEAKSVFLRTASHEIRTPIAAILGIADLLAIGGLTDEDQADLVDRLRANGRALLSLVGNVLDLSRLEADKIALTIEPVSPLELVREVVKSLESDTRRKGLEVRVESELPASMMIGSDRLRLRQILVNLVANALKFTATGAICISLRMDSGEEDHLLIDVTDTGIGIAAGQRQYLFEPFGQANSSIARSHGGTGLGLALSRRLAEQLCGTLILLQSEPGKGSTFRLALEAPKIVPPSLDLPSVVPSANGDKPRRVLDGVRILLADDNPDLQLAIGRALRLDGASVAYACNGREAVAMVQSGTFDVALMDILMPLMNGLQATRILRDQGCQIPIIALSADATPEMRAASIDAGCSAHLCKPFDPSDLVASIRFLRRSEPSTSVSQSV